jgi:hypothetical protein
VVFFGGWDLDATTEKQTWGKSITCFGVTHEVARTNLAELFSFADLFFRWVPSWVVSSYFSQRHVTNTRLLKHAPVTW